MKEVRLDDGVARDRFVICHNPEQATRDAAVRAAILARLGAAIAATDAAPAGERHERYGALRTKPAFARFLRRTPAGKLRIDRAAVAREAKLDGKFLLRTDDESLTAAAAAASCSAAAVSPTSRTSRRQRDAPRRSRPVATSGSVARPSDPSGRSTHRACHHLPGAARGTCLAHRASVAGSAGGRMDTRRAPGAGTRQRPRRGASWDWPSGPGPTTTVRRRPDDPESGGSRLVRSGRGSGRAAGLPTVSGWPPRPQGSAASGARRG